MNTCERHFAVYALGSLLGACLASSGNAAAPCPPSTETFHPTHVLVRFKPSAGKAERQHSRQSAGIARILREFRSVKNLELVELERGGVKRAVATLRKDPNVLYAEPDYVVYPVGIPNDTDFESLWGMYNTGQTIGEDPGTPGADIRAVEAWDTWTGNPDFRIAVVDTGVDYTHPDLAGNIWTNPLEIPDNGLDDDANGYVDDVHGYDFLNDDSDPMDDCTHGTHVAGTIGAVGNNAMGVAGVNWHCQIVILKFLSGG